MEVVHGLFTTLMTDLDSDVTRLMDNGARLANIASRKKHRLRAFMTMKQGFMCCYCKSKVTLTRQQQGVPIADDFATFEHLVDAFSNGGSKDDNLAKIAIACRKCNFERGQAQQTRALTYYGQFFVVKHTLRKFVEHPKVGWKGIFREFGPIPDDFVAD